MTAPNVREAPRKYHTPGLVLVPGVLLATALLPVLVRLRPPHLAAALETVPMGTPPSSGNLDEVLTWIRLAVERMERALGPLMRGSCFTRGISRFVLLRLAGIDTRLIFGAGRTNDRFAAHCWIERDGLPLYETSDPRPVFPVFFRIPRQP